MHTISEGESVTETPHDVTFLHTFSPSMKGAQLFDM